MIPPNRMEDKPIQLEAARERVVAAVTAVGAQMEELPPAARKSQQALIIAGIESLGDASGTQTRANQRTAPAREAWIDQLPFTD